MRGYLNIHSYMQTAHQVWIAYCRMMMWFHTAIESSHDKVTNYNQKGSFYIDNSVHILVYVCANSYTE